MIVLTKRQKDILIYLCSQRQYVTIKQLSIEFCVSPRTIRNDFSLISSYLLSSKINVDRKPSKGIRIDASESEISDLRNTLKLLDSRILNSYERSSIISLLLLCNPMCTFKQLADACYVSRQTVITAFKQVEDDFKQKEIKINKIQGKGIKIFGNELTIRRYFENKLSELILDDVIMSVVLKNSKLMEFDKIANKITESVENKLNIRFAEAMKIKLLLDYSFLRISNGYTLLDNKDFNKIEEVKTYKEYECIINSLGNYQLPINEKTYICNLLMNAKITELYSDYTRTYKDYNDHNDEASKISKYLFNKLGSIQQLDINSKEHFIHGLTLHLRVAIHRIRNKIAIQNELLDQIKINIPLIYEFTKKELMKCEKKFGLEFDENEIAFIAIYIDSAYEGSFNVESKLTVLLVCSFGIATSSILKTRILQAIQECNIVGPLSLKDAKKYMENNTADLIISTNDYQINNIPMITVNPLLYPEDVEYIKNRLFQLSYSKMCSHFIKSYANVDKKEKRMTCIKDYVFKENIQIADSCKTWEDAIRLSAKPLLDEGKIEERYVNRMIDAVEQFGTYMVLVPETAFIHAGTEDGIKENCTAILVLKEPVYLGNKSKKIVRSFVVLGIKNKNEDYLLRLIYIFENKSNLLSLQSKNITIDEIYNMHD